MGSQPGQGKWLGLTIHSAYKTGGEKRRAKGRKEEGKEGRKKEVRKGGEREGGRERGRREGKREGGWEEERKEDCFPGLEPGSGFPGPC